MHCRDDLIKKCFVSKVKSRIEKDSVLAFESVNVRERTYSQVICNKYVVKSSEK